MFKPKIENETQAELFTLMALKVLYEKRETNNYIEDMLIRINNRIEELTKV